MQLHVHVNCLLNHQVHVITIHCLHGYSTSIDMHAGDRLCVNTRVPFISCHLLWPNILFEGGGPAKLSLLILCGQTSYIVYVYSSLATSLAEPKGGRGALCGGPLWPY